MNTCRLFMLMFISMNHHISHLFFFLLLLLLFCLSTHIKILLYLFHAIASEALPFTRHKYTNRQHITAYRQQASGTMKVLTNENIQNYKLLLSLPMGGKKESLIFKLNHPTHSANNKMSNRTQNQQKSQQMCFVCI